MEKKKVAEFHVKNATDTDPQTFEEQVHSTKEFAEKNGMIVKAVGDKSAPPFAQYQKMLEDLEKDPTMRLL